MRRGTLSTLGGLMLLSAMGLGLSDCPWLQQPAPYHCDAPAQKGYVRAVDPLTRTGRLIVVSDATAPRPRALEDRVVIGGSALRSAPIRGAQNPGHLAPGLASTPGVLFVAEETSKHVLGWPEPEPETRARATPDLWNLDRHNARLDPRLDGNAVLAYRGAGANVCVVDTGVDLRHPALKDRMLAVHTTVGTDPQDGHGHGSHVIGTALTREYGYAWDAGALSCRALDAQGSGSDSTVIGCISWCVDRAKEFPGPMVISMSLGGAADPALDRAVCEAIAAGVPVLVAAGNDAGSASKFSPAHVSEAWTVGASQKPVPASSGEGWFE